MQKQLGNPFIKAEDPASLVLEAEALPGQLEQTSLLQKWPLRVESLAISGLYLFVLVQKMMFRLGFQGIKPHIQIYIYIYISKILQAMQLHYLSLG